jgi:hypothetical protein
MLPTSTEQPVLQVIAKPEWKAEGPSVEVEGPWLSGEELRALRRKIEWYLSDANLSQDQALHHRISQNLPEGWICCSEIIHQEGFRDVNLTPSLLVMCLRKSHLETKVTLTSDELSRARGEPGEFNSRGVYLRRRQPLPPLLSKKVLTEQQFVCDPGHFLLVDRHQTMNRLRDLWRVQRQLHLSEVGDDTTVFQERVMPHMNYANCPPVVIAVGYERIVYGDHGPYIEFASSHICWKAWPHYFDKRKYNSYFNEYYTKASHSLWEAKWNCWDPNPMKGVLLLYAQSRPVTDRPWAPGAGSDPHAGRPAGYADYRTGYYYAAADESLIIVDKQGKSTSQCRDP